MPSLSAAPPTPPCWLRELPSCLSAFMGQEEGSLSPYSLSSFSPAPPAHLLAKEQSPGSCPGPLLSSQHRRCPQSPGAVAWPHPTPIPAAGCMQGQPRPCSLEKNCVQKDGYDIERQSLLRVSAPTPLPVINLKNKRKEEKPE